VAAARREGKSAREVRGTDSPTHPRLGQREGAWPRGPVAAGRGGRGGGAGGPGRELAVAEVVVGVEGRAEGPFYWRVGARERGAGGQ
jgi:hypothetical protein